jgi:hypothetical protein
MTTPADNTPYAIIADAYWDAGKLMEGQNPSSEQLAGGMRRLRDLVNTWQTMGLKLFLNVDTEVTLTDGQATYRLGPGGDVDMVKPMRVIQGYYKYTATNVRRPFTSLSWNDYLTLGQAGTLAANRGTISQYFVNKQATYLDVTFWLCPNDEEADNGSAWLLLQVQATNPVSLTETMAFPLEWRMALRWGLADQLSVGQPDSVAQRCMQNAARYKADLENWDVEDAPTSFQVDSRMGNPNSFE